VQGWPENEPVVSTDPLGFETVIVAPGMRSWFSDTANEMNWPASPEKVSCIAWPVSDAVTLDVVPTDRVLVTGAESVSVIVPEPVPVCWTTTVYVPPMGNEPRLMTAFPE